jgi:hypothetical protein
MSLSAKTARGFYTATAKKSIVKIKPAVQLSRRPAKVCNPCV